MELDKNHCEYSWLRITIISSISSHIDSSFNFCICVICFVGNVSRYQETIQGPLRAGFKGKEIEQFSIEGEVRWGNNETETIKWVWMQKWNIEEREGDGNVILGTFKMLCEIYYCRFLRYMNKQF